MTGRPSRFAPRRAKLTGALCALIAAGLCSAAAPGTATAATTLPSRAAQIAKLENAEKLIARQIKQNGSDARYDDIALDDLRSFNVEPLWDQGIDGAGTTVALLEGWNWPPITGWIDYIDRSIGLPDPVIDTVYPAGRLPKRCPSGMVKLGVYGDCSDWAEELTLDVEVVHLFAPYARIVLAVTPPNTEIEDDTSDQIAPAEMMRALEYLSNRHIADVVSSSDGSGETDYRDGHPEILAQELGTITAAADGVPFTNATGDCGPGQELVTGDGFCNELTRGRAVATWDDSPYAIAVGGNLPDYTFTGTSSQDGFRVWNVRTAEAGFNAAENAGVSRVYRRPFYQDGVATRIGSPWRAVPDITMDAADGTSQAAPQFAGILALATQLHGGDLGAIDPLLYDTLGPAGATDGIVDITKGNDTSFGIPGFAAGPGYDIATGWGTINAARFVPALAAAVAQQHGFGPLTALARARLSALEHSISLSSSRVRPGATVIVDAGDFLPRHPVLVYVDGRRVLRTWADARGNVHFQLPTRSPQLRLRLRAGVHRLALQSMLLRQSATFTVR